jgi:hypothetical protein
MTNADESAAKIEEERIGSLSEGGWASKRRSRAPSRMVLVSNFRIQQNFRNPCQLSETARRARGST